MTEDVKAYYASFAQREWTRLDNPADGQVEFAVTCDALLRHLPVGLESELPTLLGDSELRGLVLGLAIEHAADPNLLALARHLLYVGERRPRADRPEI